MRIVLISFFLLLCSCSGIRSRYHYVEPGDSLARIAKHYDVPVNQLESHNEATLARGLKPGTKLYVPFEENPRWNEEYLTPEIEREPLGTPVSGSVSTSAVKFTWPVGGTISSLFGKRRPVRHGSEDHEGIDISARRGTPVKASRSGHIIYAGNRVAGYGNLIIIKHADQFSTVYAHLSRFHVKKGQFVARGQRIGSVGRTGRASGNHLHFEIRDKQTPVDPLLFLQGQYATNNILAR